MLEFIIGLLVGTFGGMLIMGAIIVMEDERKNDNEDKV